MCSCELVGGLVKNENPLSEIRDHTIITSSTNQQLKYLLQVSCPYDIPESLPPVLMLLADHLHDPVPIPATVKKVFQVEFFQQIYNPW